MHASAKFRELGWLIGIPVVAGLLPVLFFFEPTHFPFYPKCFLHQWTGLSCPGCGGLRASHQLLHGNIVEAFRLNPLLILMLPLFGWMLMREFVRRCHGRIFPSPFENRIFGWTVAVLVVLFGIARNLPYPLFAWMKA